MKPASLMAPPTARGFFDPDRKPQRPAALPVAVAPPLWQGTHVSDGEQHSLHICHLKTPGQSGFQFQHGHSILI